MRFHVYVDEAGYRRRVLLRDGDPDNVQIGIPADPPDLAGLGLDDEVRRELHNELFARGLFTWQDVMAQGNGITATVMRLAARYQLSDASALKRQIVQRYRR